MWLNIVQKGISHNLFKVGAKRRRSKIQMEDDRDMEKRQKEEIEAKMASFEQMKSQVDSMAE